MVVCTITLAAPAPARARVIVPRGSRVVARGSVAKGSRTAKLTTRQRVGAGSHVVELRASDRSSRTILRNR